MKRTKHRILKPQRTTPMPTPMPIGNQAQKAALAGSGLAIFEDRIAAAHSIVGTIDTTLRQLSERMYDPKTAGMHDGIDRDVPALSSTIEARLTELVSRLRTIESLATKLLGQ